MIILLGLVSIIGIGALIAIHVFIGGSSRASIPPPVPPNDAKSS